jgi:hypothetical protein
MYRDDDLARDARAHSLITEIAELERDKLARAELDHRLETARRELAALQTPVVQSEPPAPGVAAHLLAFGAAAVATFAGYSLLM